MQDLIDHMPNKEGENLEDDIARKLSVAHHRKYNKKDIFETVPVFGQILNKRDRD